MSERVCILGGGAWGTALAVHAVRRGLRVRQWILEPEVVHEIRNTGVNGSYLPGVALPDALHPTHDPDEAVHGAAWVLAVVPSQHARGVYERLTLPAGTPVVCAAKGIEEESLRLPTEVLAETLGAVRPVAVLSGPSFAADVAAGKPTALVAASDDAALASRVQRLLASTELRIYTNDDPVGVQLAAALKNVMALAAGILDGLGIGPNGRAALITRGLAEITRLGVRLGGHPETFAGLAGLGDLVLTATGGQSRNLTVGRRLGAGESLRAILDSSRAIAEGVRTTRSALRLARRAGVTMPIVEEVHRILYEGGRPEESVQRLMDRPLVAERVSHEAHDE